MFTPLSIIPAKSSPLALCKAFQTELSASLLQAPVWVHEIFVAVSLVHQPRLHRCRKPV